VVYAKAGHIQAVAGLNFGDLCVLHRLCEPRVALEVWFYEINKTDWLARESKINGSKVKVPDLLDREECEATPTRDYTCQVLWQIPMSCRPDTVSDPERNSPLALAVQQRHGSLRHERRKMASERHAASIESGRLGIIVVPH
jgi:hypothetical protein